MSDSLHEPRWKVWLAFGIIYFAWGSTFLAIRVGVHEVAPLLLATMRFLTAGMILLGWVLLRGQRWPPSREWVSAFVLGALIFVGDYGLLFWAEQRVPSGIAAVMMATIPAFIAIAEIFVLRTLRFSWRLGCALLLGLAGVAVLMSRSLHVAGAPVDATGALALILASLCWSIATVLTRKMTLPESKVMSSAMQMVAGGLLLLIASVARGDVASFHAASVSRAAWGSLLYLIVVGSIIGFTAYVWLLHRQSPTKVGTYAYVNPMVAVLLGYFAGGEGLGMRTVVGMTLILVSVVVITTMRKQVGS